MYNFPRTRYVDTNGVYDQMKHMRSEMEEVSMAFYSEPEIDRLAEEALDLIHSCETMLRILQERRGVNVWEVAIKLEAKNAERGYYCGENPS